MATWAAMRTCGLIVTAASLALALGGALPGGDGEKRAERVRIAGLIKRLGDDDYDRREEATRELTAIGEPALAALRQAMASKDPETRRRAGLIVRDITARLFAVAARKELAKWQGAWEEKQNGMLFIKGDRWSWTPKGMKPIYLNIIRIVEIREKMTLADLLVDEPTHPMKGRTVKAIFRLDGDTLHYGGTYNLPRPTAFIKGRGDPYYVEWRRVKK